MIRRTIAVVLGVLAVLPLVYGLIFAMRLLLLEPGVNPPPLPLSEYVNWHIAMMILSGLLYLIFMAVTFLSTRVPSNMRVRWAILLLVAHIFLFPVFWYLYVWRTSQRMS
jgi:hypothetical protein